MQQSVQFMRAMFPSQASRREVSARCLVKEQVCMGWSEVLALLLGSETLRSSNRGCGVAQWVQRGVYLSVGTGSGPREQGES